MRPDLYAQHPRSELERIASGDALRDLQQEIDRTQRALEETQKELAEYRCPFCSAPLLSKVNAPGDPEHKVWDDREEFECGYRVYGGSVEQPCPSDPLYPKLDEYEFQYDHSPDEPKWAWQCYAMGKTAMARRLRLRVGCGRTREEAEVSVREDYDRYARKRASGKSE
ncbi:hypothetical protein [Cupriavidus oxalaticus]|uniref:hypothetical protein n=1 Tax=Cupriavidus oxalaticus TaxID=96344 RepID=UPI001243F62C|nr:hypothetical protein [Cupriavidus oxalaticus]